MKLSEVLLAPLPGATDWRQPEHRREVFQDFYECHTSLGVHPGLVYALIPYLRKWYGWDDEQALWFAFLNGNSQHPLTSLMLHRRGSDTQSMQVYISEKGRAIRACDPVKR